MFRICTLKNMWICNKQTNKWTSRKYIFVVYYYWATCFGRFCDHHYGVTREYKTRANNRTKCI